MSWIPGSGVAVDCVSLDSSVPVKFMAGDVAGRAMLSTALWISSTDERDWLYEQLGAG